ncbi:hypothetical protein NDN08_002239 [Rhodosorus marinus]|uniref:DNA excision repair protein ERCC-6 n=1 Tax=Rhodosorus marinus TaxID=101924 RepID=A0AAV8UT67_9RHOD|nr:hypothetical protein NDN08_002239 [Rhodosorus marinus]
MREGELKDVSFGEVSVRNAEEEEARVVQQWENDCADDLQSKRRKRVDLFEDELVQLQKDLEDLKRKDPNNKKEIAAKRRKVVDARIRAEDAQAALAAADAILQEQSEETERDRLLRTGQITPFSAVQVEEKEDEVHLSKAAPATLVQTNDEEGNDEGDREIEDETLEGGLRIPGAIYQNLFPYQRTGLKWMWELHQQECGGILGDEMGLGKTVQIIAFLACLDYSEKLDGNVLIVVPATLLQQWKREFFNWWPSVDVRILHQSDMTGGLTSGELVRKQVRALRRSKGALVTTYELVRRNRDPFIVADWAYVILDEGHRIRNPDADVTLTIKRLETPHRIIMSGSPIQNRLRELWSLFDFIFPGKLGTLPVFEREFSVPIAIGGYATASAAQIHTAYHCAIILKDLITPYVLRRMKKDVAIQLPEKHEQILFCRMTEYQKEKYLDYLSGRDVRSVLTGNLNMLVAASNLRKICNHPDIFEPPEEGEEYGSLQRSGKLTVLSNVLEGWHSSKNRVLLFTQTTTLLDLIQSFILKRNYAYLRMDGSTPVSKRMALIDRFNTDEEVFIFLLTTKVGGFGINLTGADRVVLYEPDWNPSNDLQARERSWRIGQKREVIIYRLVTRGTIEEKIYHRQIYKQFLSNKVLNDPKQRRFFKAKDMNDLFTYHEEYEGGTETGDIFAGVDVEEVKQRGDDVKPEPTYEAEIVEDDDEPERQKKGDASILQNLFESEGLHSTINHDHILQAGETSVDMQVIEHEATRIAREAARALRESRRERLQQSVAVPTWTGRSGDAGRPTFGRRVGSGGGRASKILDKIKERNTGAPRQQMDANVELIGKIRDFLTSKGGSAATIDLVNHFKDTVPGKQMVTFKELLKRVARISKSGPTGSSKWTLIEE